MDADDHPPFARDLQRCAEELAQSGIIALGDLYDLTAPRLVRYACTFTRNQPDAEDVLQMVMVRIATKPQLLANATFQWAYLLRMVRNEALTLLQRKPPGQLPPQLPSPLESPADCLLDADREEYVRAALAKLPPEQSEVVILKIWEEMTFAEIADVLNESANTVASRYRYALQKLTERLKPYADEVLHE